MAPGHPPGRHSSRGGIAPPVSTAVSTPPGSPFAASETARWLRRWMGLAVAVLALVTVVTPFVEEMPVFHHLAVPVAVAVVVAAWVVELAGVRWPRLALVAAVVLPNVWLTSMGHFGANYLFLLLLVAWIELVGGRAERAAALVLALGVLGLGLVVNVEEGDVNVGAWTSYLVIVLMAWSMGLVLRRQDRMVGELRLRRSESEQRGRDMAVLEERQRLSRELHDSVTQSLYAVSLHAEAAARALGDGETVPATENLDEIRATVQEALGEMRLLLFELRPAPLDDHGLAGALQMRLRAVEARSGLAAEFEGDEALRLRPEAERELYRVAQEALNNVLKHAHASRVIVRLDTVDGHATLEVADDGVGFEPALRGRGGFGLPGMRERVERLGGTLAVESAPGAGTRVRAEVPR